MYNAWLLLARTSLWVATALRGWVTGQFLAFCIGIQRKIVSVGGRGMKGGDQLHADY